ncbi:MAG TPA: FAD-dependent oxidoreductase, partial [Chloroflexota bacterium]|nr:FAD-dependent oxidoreductase [Chloroflexota bacterium]
LNDWQAATPAPTDGLRLLGHRWSALAHEIKSYLARNLVPYHWMDVETSAEARHLVALAGAQPTQLPLVLFPDGSHLAQPTIAQLAGRLGLRMHAERPSYDLIIVGAGPGGLAAAVYGASEGLRTLLIEREAPGGQAGLSSRIENYLGFPSGLSGGDLARRAVAQATRFGAEILTPQEAVGLRVEGSLKYVKLADGSEIGCRALVIATGVAYRRLEVPGIDSLVGAGVYYGATVMDAAAHAGQDVFVVGGANSAGQAAVGAARTARTVTMLVRADSLSDTMSSYLIEQLAQTPNVTIRFQTTVQAVAGSPTLESITIADATTGATETLPAGALFVFIGASPHTSWLDGVIERDTFGFVFSGNDVLALPRRGGWPLDRAPYTAETSVPGVFAAGDVRHGASRHVATSVGEGSATIPLVWQYLESV